MLSPSYLNGHPGAVDSNGGHVNRKTGEYHSHGSPADTHKQASQSDARYRDKTSTSKTTRSSKNTSAAPLTNTSNINDYFRSKNENVGALDCNLVIHVRDVDESKKRIVKHRDGNRCVICGSKNKLEVDHMRGLQNGGNNEIYNLALLCDNCHTAKTKNDNSLRRKRETVCRKK
jgi:predicted restriction endonuclease